MLEPPKFSGQDVLDMEIVTEPTSPWFNQRIVPRMIKSQLVHFCELNVIRLDRSINYQRRQGFQDPVVQVLVYFFLLHTRELDAGRNIYWSRYIDNVPHPVLVPRQVANCFQEHFWQHPSTPRYLLDEATASCKQLLSEWKQAGGNQAIETYSKANQLMSLLWARISAWSQSA